MSGERNSASAIVPLGKELKTMCISQNIGEATRYIEDPELKISRPSWGNSRFLVKRSPIVSNGESSQILQVSMDGVIPWCPTPFDLTANDWVVAVLDEVDTALLNTKMEELQQGQPAQA